MLNFLKRIYAFYSRYPLFFRLGVVVILFSILFSNIHPREILEAFHQARGKYLIYAVILMIPNIALQIFKWNYILRTTNPRPSLKCVSLSVIGGFFLGATSPARTGELARGLLMPGQSRLRIASLTFLDKGFNQIMVIFTGLISFILILPWPLSALPIIGELILIVILFNINRLKPGLESFLHRYIHSQRAENILAAFHALSKKTVWGMVVYSLVFYIVYAFQYYAIFLCFADLPFLTALKILPIVYLINIMLPVAVGDFGVKEMAAVKLLVPFGIAGGAAFIATFMNNVLTFLIPSLMGGILITFFHPLSVEKALSSTDCTTPLSE